MATKKPVEKKPGGTFYIKTPPASSNYYEGESKIYRTFGEKKQDCGICGTKAVLPPNLSGYVGGLCSTFRKVLNLKVGKTYKLVITAGEVK